MSQVTINETRTVKDIMVQYLNKGISRRGFVTALAGIGISAAGITTLVKNADAVETSVTSRSGRMFTGTGGELCIQQALDAGVKYCFTAPGSAEAGFFDAMFDTSMIMMEGLHEGIVVAMGCGYTRATKGLAFVNLHVMGGTAQAAGQMVNAAYDEAPLVMTSGQNETESFNDDSGLSPAAGWPQTDVNRMFCKQTWTTRDAAAMAHQTRRIFKVATTFPQGPAWLMCVGDSAFAGGPVTDVIYKGEDFMIQDDVPGNPDKINAVAAALLAAKAPVLWVGGEVYKQSAEAEVVELAELLGIPTCADTSMFACFPTKHPLYAGGWNAKGKDLVVGIGAINWRERRGNLENDTPVVMITLGLDDLGRNQTFSMAIPANTKTATRQLIDALKSQATAAQLKAKADAGMAKAPNAGNVKPDPAILGKSLMHLEEFPWIVENNINKDAIIMHEAFASPRQYYTIGHRAGEKGFHRTGGGSLGFGIGCATGIKVGCPDRQVVNVIGDGAVMFSAAGWWTQARSSVPVLTIISNNHNYETVRSNYYRYGKKMKTANRYIGMMLDRPDNDFVKMANAQGLEGIKVQTPQDFPAAIKRGSDIVANGTGCVLDVDIERNMTTGGDSNWIQEFSLAALRTVRV